MGGRSTRRERDGPGKEEGEKGREDTEQELNGADGQVQATESPCFICLKLQV